VVTVMGVSVGELTVLFYYRKMFHVSIHFLHVPATSSKNLKIESSSECSSDSKYAFSVT